MSQMKDIISMTNCNIIGYQHNLIDKQQSKRPLVSIVCIFINTIDLSDPSS